MRSKRYAAATLAAATLGLAAAAYHADARDAQGHDPIARGRYLVKIAGCNDCHTPGYGSSGGKVPEDRWLTGDRVGWNGPWGTTYPANLRLALNGMSEDHWVHLAKTAKYRPPMPWFALHDMSEQDLRDIHRYVRSLGPAGEPAPAYLPPEAKPSGPVIAFPR
ncbi:MAG TPA: c-type cytochrome [Usitatibacter sp.]|nr:c-type cytochrome [Usitatibacter sp.]